MAVTRTRTHAHARARSRRLVLFVVMAALAALAVVGASLIHGALAAPATTRAPHSTTAPDSHDAAGSGRRLWSAFKHLWTNVGMAGRSPHVGRVGPPPDVRAVAAAAGNADGRRTPTVVSVYAAQGRDGFAGGGPRAHTAYFGSRLNEAADQR
ncbi:hypothetical protein BCL76_105316 [Streptomyces sp. CG 926]|uniref:hypothetical protein n=1 Tax=Streptomyces sp. CG 926 TaxID=1882405 RepID=UPI000D6D4A92|nr:hypothetical protein [Streptomyces sp. CG 926]PWK70363.1 hypothetical protein BCL76_105316 [Streptomyces sp. CG 926]